MDIHTFAQVDIAAIAVHPRCRLADALFARHLVADRDIGGRLDRVVIGGRMGKVCSFYIPIPRCIAVEVGAQSCIGEGGE